MILKIKSAETQRLDKVSDGGIIFSRSALQKYIKKGFVRVNGRVIDKPHFLVHENDEISIDAPQKTAIEKRKAVLFRKIFEDNYIIVIDKPPFCVSSDIPAVMNKSWHCSHRLDKDTSGILVIAKDSSSLEALQSQWRNRAVEKEYTALVKGHLPERGLISGPIARSFKNRRKMAVAKGPKFTREAKTEFEVEREFSDVSLVKIKPLTGRTHQIRVHFSSIHHPIAGDSLYGDKKLNEKFAEFGLNRQFLHASALIFRHPETHKKIILKSSLPEDLAQVLKNLSNEIRVTY